MPSLNLTLPFPPSVNHYWYSSFKTRRIYVSNDGKVYKNSVWNEVHYNLPQKTIRNMPWITNFDVKIVLCPSDSRKRDLDNYLKALFDALTYAKVWKDDSQVKHIDISWGKVTRPSCAKVQIYDHV